MTPGDGVTGIASAQEKVLLREQMSSLHTGQFQFTQMPAQHTAGSFSPKQQGFLCHLSQKHPEETPNPQLWAVVKATWAATQHTGVDTPGDIGRQCDWNGPHTVREATAIRHTHPEA